MFNKYIDADIRKNRPTATVTEESLTNRFEVMLPAWLIKDQRVLDLGSALGAAGHWCLHHGAAHYTGVEIQQSAATKSQELLSSDYPTNLFNIVNSDLSEFVQNNKDQWDIVIAAGVIHGYFNPYDIIEKITKLSSKYIVVETLNIPETNSVPTIHLCNMNMVNYHGNNQPYQGMTPAIGINAFEIIINEYGFAQDGEQLYPKRIVNSHDAYNDVMQWRDLAPSTQRFIARYKKTNAKNNSLELKIKKNISSSNQPTLAIHDGIKFNKNDKTWKFDDGVAERFYEEALSNIPDYTQVVDLCVKVANNKFNKDAQVVDIGSALGYTVNRFIEEGYNNIIGVEASVSMINFSAHKNRIMLSEIFPKSITADLILANWTLHFIADRKKYIQDMFDALVHGGAVVITDKTTQSTTIKNLYYDFKRNNGVSNEYIALKEEKLKGYMTCVDSVWYIDTLTAAGFKNVQIINSKLGFVTFYAEK